MWGSGSGGSGQGRDVRSVPWHWHFRMEGLGQDCRCSTVFGRQVEEQKTEKDGQRARRTGTRRSSRQSHRKQELQDEEEGQQLLGI